MNNNFKIKNLFLSVGAMKAGTTWLYVQLDDHPDIYVTPVKETHYFESMTGKWNLLSHEDRIQKFKMYTNMNQKSIDNIYWYVNYAKSPHIDDNWYQSLFENSNKMYCADFCNLNCFLGKSGWLKVRENFYGKLRVIYCLRDPFKRVWSHYKFHMEWIGKGDKIVTDFKNFKSLLEEDFFYDVVRYDRAIDRLEKELSKDELKIYYFEDFRKKPQESLNNLYDFLEIAKVETNKTKLDTKVNSSQTIDLPEEWKDYLWDYLSPVYIELGKRGMLHEDWIKFGSS